MTQTQSKIQFHNLIFYDDLPKLGDVETRLKKFLETTRSNAQRVEMEAGRITEQDRVYPYDLVDDTDRRRIKRRAMRLLDCLHSSTGMRHLIEENRARLTSLRGGSPVARVATEHEAVEIAAALHAEMPWMSPATEAVWHGLSASARERLPGLRFNPLVLIGSPGIGKSHWGPSYPSQCKRLPVNGPLYDADCFREALQDEGIRPCTPGRKSRSKAVQYPY